MTTDRQVGANVRRLRKAHGMSQSGLAKRLGGTFHQATVDRLEHGNRRLRLSEAAQICHVFNVDIDRLLMVDEDDITDARIRSAETRVSETWMQIQNLVGDLAGGLADLEIALGSADREIPSSLGRDYVDMFNRALTQAIQSNGRRDAAQSYLEEAGA